MASAEIELTAIDHQLAAALARARQLLIPDEMLTKALQDVLHELLVSVQAGVLQFFNDEFGRSYANVVGQIKSFKTNLVSLVALDRSEDVQELKVALRELKDSKILLLERAANNIHKYSVDLKECIESKDFRSFNILTSNLTDMVYDFEQKYEKLAPMLNGLEQRYEKLVDKFREGKDVSLKFQAEAGQRRVKLLRIIDGIFFVGGAVTCVLFPFLSLPLHKVFDVLAGLSTLGKIAVKKVLSDLLRRESQQHGHAAAAFAAMEDRLRSMLEQVRSSNELYEKVAEAIDGVNGTLMAMKDEANNADRLNTCEGLQGVAERTLARHTDGLKRLVNDLTQDTMILLKMLPEVAKITLPASPLPHLLEVEDDIGVMAPEGDGDEA